MANNLELLALLHINRGYYEGCDEIIYAVDTDHIPGKDFPKIFDEKVRIILDTVIDDAKQNEHFMRTRLFSTGSYSGPFRDSIEELIAEANRQKRARDQSQKRQIIGKRDMNFDPFFYIGLFFGMGIGYLANQGYGALVGAGIGAVTGIGFYALRERLAHRNSVDTFPLANRAEDYQRMLDVMEVRR